ncbi:MAG: hypothetical protein M1419_10620 [Bacteroidetes bacterium]|nr:hypothetical protein [Bacteroidota bacterium]
MESKIRKLRKDKIIYSINIEDLQNVADEVLERKLTNQEIKLLIDKIGDYFDWYDSIDRAIMNNIMMNH